MPFTGPLNKWTLGIMTDNMSAAGFTSQNKHDSPQSGASTTDGVLQSGERAHDENVGLMLLALILVATVSALFLSQSEPGGTWGVATTSAVASALVVYIVSRVLPHYFWGVLVICAVLVYVASLAYQAGAPRRTFQQQTWIPQSVQVDTKSYSLVISYPAQAPFQASDQPGLPLFVYFDSANASSGVMTTSSIAFTLAFLPKNQGLVFTDDKGVPVLPQIAVRVGEQFSQPAALYVRSALTSTQPASVTIALAARPNSLGAAWQDLNSIVISTESSFWAWWRRFLGLLLGPATPILALVATLLGFGWQWRQSERQKQEEYALEISSVAIALQAGLVPGALKYHEIREKAKTQRWQSDLIEHLDKYRKLILSLNWEEELVNEIMRALEKNDTDTAEKLRSTINDLGKDREASTLLPQAIDLAIKHSKQDANGRQLQTKNMEELTTAVDLSFATIERYGAVVEKKYLAILKNLGELEGAAPAILGHLERATKRGDSALLRKAEFGEMLSKWEAEGGEIGRRAKSLKELRKNSLSWLRPYLWYAPRPESSPAVERWLDSQSLAYNPFGPKYAQQDNELPDYVVRGVFEEAAGRRPVLVLAAPGAGRSAAAMILANDCVDPPRDPREKRAFPVYCAPTIYDLTKTSERSYLRLMSIATSRWLCRLIVQIPENFLELSDSRKACLVQLLRESLGLWPLIEHALRQANPDGNVDRVLREMQPFAKSSVTGLGSNPDVWTDLLECSLPKAYECVEVFFDVPTPESLEQRVAIANGLTPLLDSIMPLSSKGIFLKLFVPTLPDLTPPPGCETITMTWTEQRLKEMLKGRIKTKEDRLKPFNELFDLSLTGGDPEDLLVETAAARMDAPRYLIRLGNALLLRHVEQGGSGKMIASTLEAVIKELQ